MARPKSKKIDENNDSNISTIQEKAPKSKVQKQTRTLRVPSEEQIRNKAYALYVSRGCQHGNDHEDWVKAEQLLLEELSK